MDKRKTKRMTAAPRLLEALAHLNQIGSAINQLDTSGLLARGDLASIQTVLGMIVTSATEVVPGSSAVLYTYDATRGVFDHQSRVAAGEETIPGLDDSPRADGLGSRAASRRQRVISYEEEDLEINAAKVSMGARVMVCFPLMVGGEVLGVLYVYLHEDRGFSELELLMLENFVNLAAMTLSLARQFFLAQQEQARKERELRRLRRAGWLISSRSNLKGTLDAILQVALEVTDAIYGIFRLVDRSGKNLIYQAISGSDLEKPAVETLPIDEHSVMGTVALRREPVIISDLRDAPWSQVYYPLDHELAMRSELAVPLIGASGRLEGVLNLESPQVNAFDKQDRYILQILASQAVVAIQEARLLDTLLEIASLLPRLTTHEIYQALVVRARDLLNIPAAMIWLLEKDQLVLHAATGSGMAGLRLSLDQALAGQAVRTSAPVTVTRSGEGEEPVYPDLPDFQGKGAALVIPLLSSPQGKPIGAFGVHTGAGDTRDFAQSDWDNKVLDILGHYAALAIQLSQQQEALRVAQDQRALTETFAAIGDIAANLLHRLNNKVGTIPVRVEGIQDKCAAALADDPYLEKNLAEIQRSAAEAMEVVRESLFHLNPIQLAPVSVAGSVREALSATRLPAGIEVVTEGLDGLPAVQAGQQRLALVFSNLLENASDAMGGKGRITIRGMAVGSQVEVQVSDNGPGIQPELHERIFEFNYSARGERAGAPGQPRAHPGKLGFGLWWVKSLMARFGGNVTVESDGHSGTTFLLSLPQAGQILRQAASEQGQDPVAGGSPAEQEEAWPTR
jgi:signal transduction histidine kinase/putative methionine-R-sulfoxide reductase with GAF domain